MKGQAALEFLMTYGWAILIVIAVVAALYAMGVFRLPTGGIGKCSPCFPPGSVIAYVDHNADNIVVRVGPEDIRDVSVIVNNEVVATQSGPFSPGSTITFTNASKFKGDVTVTIQYTSVASGLTHSVSATLHGA